MTKKGKLDKKAFKEYLTDLFISDNNIFAYLSESEIAQLKARWPEEYWKDAGNEEITIQHMLGLLKSPRSNLDWKIVGNMFKALALIGHGREQMYADRYSDTIEIFIDGIVRYVFG